MDSQNTVDSLLGQIQTLATGLGDDARQRLSSALGNLSVKLENPHDTLFRIVYQPLELCTVQVGVDLGLFHVLVKAKKPLSVTEIATQVGADPLLIGRLCRFYQSYRLVDEKEKDLFAASNITHTLTDSTVEAGVKHQFYFVNKCCQELPRFLKETGYKNPDDGTNAPFSRAFNTDQMAFVWVQDQPFTNENFGKFMSTYQKGKPKWTSVVPIRDQLKSWTASDRPLFVDIGGGMGSQAADFWEATKDLVSGRIVLQDLGPTLAVAPEILGVEKLEADFFKPQPVRGAKYYFIKSVLHDYPDAMALKILGNVKDAMEDDSVLLLDEMVVPDTGAHSHATQLDLTMMAVLAATERTRSQWYDLIEKGAGLKIREIRTFEQIAGDSIIEVVKA